MCVGTGSREWWLGNGMISKIFCTLVQYLKIMLCNLLAKEKNVKIKPLVIIQYNTYMSEPDVILLSQWEKPFGGINKFVFINLITYSNA